MTDLSVTRTGNLPWLHSPRFDVAFLLGTLTLAIVAGVTVLAVPSIFWVVLTADLWLLGYHHVISTYTRLCFDRASFSERGLLVYGLLPLVAVLTIVLATVFGLWLIVSTYFYWQWWHYARQSWGISRAYRAKDKGRVYDDGWLDQATFYAIPVLGILNRSHQDPGFFLRMELRVIPVPDWLLAAAATATAALMVLWCIRRLRSARLGQASTLHTLYMLSHFTIFGVGYLAVTDISIGWLMINIWHNAQYILFVWLFNRRRFRDGIDPKATFLSSISQSGQFWRYAGTCVAITGVIYWGVLRPVDQIFFAAISASLVLYQIVNFHHYIVDSLIWKVRKPHIRQTLGL